MATFKDTSFSKQNIPLLSSEASARGKLLKNVKYHLTMVMPKDKDYFTGEFKTTFDLSSHDHSKFHIDFHGEQISHVEVNGQKCEEADIKFHNHRIKIEKSGLLKDSENSILLNFKNTYVDNSAGLHKYVDPKD